MGHRDREPSSRDQQPDGEPCPVLTLEFLPMSVSQAEAASHPQARVGGAGGAVTMHTIPTHPGREAGPGHQPGGGCGGSRAGHSDRGQGSACGWGQKGTDLENTRGKEKT